MVATIYEIEKAISEANRFISAAKKTLTEREDPDYRRGGQHNAAMKRASMDLTRALVGVRR